MNNSKQKNKVENLKYHFKFWFKKIFVSFSMFAILLSALSACQQKNSDNSGNTVVTPVVPINQVGVANCTNCGFNQVQFFQTLSQGGNSFPVAINWQVLADQNSILQITNTYGYINPRIYSGMIYAKGAMTISASSLGFNNFNGIWAGQCQIPAGQYTFNALQAAQYSGGSIGAMDLEAISGGVRVIFRFTNGMIVAPSGGANVDRIAGYLVPIQITGVNGLGAVNCGDPGAYIN